MKAAASDSPQAQGAEPEGDDPVGGADLALDTAKTALAVVAACSIVLEGGPQQVEEAKKLTAKVRPDVPRALWRALLRIAEGKGATAKHES